MQSVRLTQSHNKNSVIVVGEREMTNLSSLLSQRWKYSDTTTHTRKNYLSENKSSLPPLEAKARGASEERRRTIICRHLAARDDYF